MMTLRQMIEETQDCGQRANQLYYNSERTRAFKVLKHLQSLLAKWVLNAANEPPEDSDD